MSLHHRLEGPDGASVLVLSGSLGTTLELWDANVAALTRRHRVLRYDHRGHGRSEIPPGPYTVADLSNDVVELLDRLELDRVSFCGLSLGGAVGMWLGSRFPDRIERLTLCSASPRFGEPDGWRERAATVRARGTGAIADTVVRRWFTPPFQEERPEVVARFRDMLASAPRDGYAACCDALAAWDFRGELGSIGVPTLVVAGADDPVSPPEQAELIAEQVPRATLVVLPSAAHLPNVEQPEAFARAVLGDAEREAA